MEHTNARPRSSILVLGVIGAIIVANAGDLSPPEGPVGPTMKTLDQIEPRIVINSTNTPGDDDAQFIISQPGSYYLDRDIYIMVTGGVKDGISIRRGAVTLDLNGFALRGGFGARNGIIVESEFEDLYGIAIRNGTVSGFSEDGIQAGEASSGRYENLSLVRNRGYGMGANYAVVISCNFDNNMGEAGFTSYTGCTLENCTASNNTQRGFWVWSGTIRGCTANNNGTTGFNVLGCLVQGNAAYGNPTNMLASGSTVVDNYAP